MTPAELSILITIGVNAVGWFLHYRKSVKKEGEQEAQHEEKSQRIAELEKTMTEKVATVLFKDEIQEIHGRISRMQSEQAATLKEQSGKIDRLLENTSLLTGKIQMWATMKGLPGGEDHT